MLLSLPLLYDINRNMSSSTGRKIKNEFSDILDILSGEMQLREKEEKLEKMKEEAKGKIKAERRRKIAEKEVVLEESDIPVKKVTQNIKLFEWFVLDNFWFSIKNGQYFLIVETRLRYPKALILLIDRVDKDAIFVLLQDKVLYKDIRKQGRLDILTYGNYIPFEEI